MKARLLNSKLLVLGFFLILLFPPSGHSQEIFPSRPITFINPTPPGTGPDLACRLISKEAEKFLGQPIVTLNKPGASHTIGISAIVEIRLLFLIAESRSADYPEIPILRDLGYDFPAPTFLNVAGPKGMPEEIVKKLEDAFTKAMKEPAFIKGMRDLRFATPYRNSKELTEYVAHSYDAFAKLLKEIGMIK